MLGLDLVALAVGVPRLVSRMGLVGSGSSIGVSVDWSVEAVSWFVGLSDWDSLGPGSPPQAARVRAMMRVMLVRVEIARSLSLRIGGSF